MKKALSILLCLAMLMSLMAGCSSGTKPAEANSSETYKVALITMDSIDQHWITLKEGAEKAAAELGVDVTEIIEDEGYSAVSNIQNSNDSISSELFL